MLEEKSRRGTEMLLIPKNASNKCVLTHGRIIQHLERRAVVFIAVQNHQIHARFRTLERIPKALKLLDPVQDGRGSGGNIITIVSED